MILAPFPETVGRLVEVLGGDLVAFIAGLTDEDAGQTIQDWIDGKSAPDLVIQYRIHLTVDIANILSEEGNGIIRVWFMGKHPADNKNPAILVRNAITKEDKDDCLRRAEELAFDCDCD